MATIPDDIRSRHQFTVRDYYRMAEVGILSPDSRVELIEGEIIDMPPIGSRHAGTVEHLAQILRLAVADRAMVRVQHPVSLGALSEPQPDLAVVRPRPDYYRTAHPGQSDILLIVEVADSTLRYDQAIKVPLYARKGIREYWVVDLDQKQLHRYRDPHDVGYARIDRPDLQAPLVVSAIPELALDLRPLFD